MKVFQLSARRFLVSQGTNGMRLCLMCTSRVLLRLAALHAPFAVYLLNDFSQIFLLLLSLLSGENIFFRNRFSSRNSHSRVTHDADRCGPSPHLQSYAIFTCEFIDFHAQKWNSIVNLRLFFLELCVNSARERLRVSKRRAEHSTRNCFKSTVASSLWRFFHVFINENGNLRNSFNFCHELKSFSIAKSSSKHQIIVRTSKEFSYPDEVKGEERVEKVLARSRFHMLSTHPNSPHWKENRHDSGKFSKSEKRKNSICNFP